MKRLVTPLITTAGTLALSDTLVKAGVGSDKLQANAFGEQRPQCSESAAACWQSDRRVDVGFRTGN